jgi:MFS family permease
MFSHSLYTVGQIFGGLMSGAISDKFGRRAGMFAGCFLVVVGSILVSSAHVIKQLLAGRFVLGWGIAIAVSCAPSYCVEVRALFAIIELSLIFSRLPHLNGVDV